MKQQRYARAFLLVILISAAQFAYSQFYILGRALDDQEQPYAFCTAQLRGNGTFTEQKCTELGVFRFENLASGDYELIVITPYGIRRKKIDLRGSVDITFHISRSIRMNEISVIARRAGNSEPVTHDDITAEELKKKDFGQDMPYLLEGSPSVVATSDAGVGIGYTSLRIRGTDPTRINVTLNGIPVNDAESHTVYWVDLPDIASSTNNIQITRGIGWSQPGVGDFGGGIQINTLGFNFEPELGIQLGGGSFGARRATLNASSGLIRGRFTLDGRGSYIHSDGYIDRAKSDLYSAYGCAGYHHDQSNVSFLVAMGNEDTYQAWNGVPEQYVFNPELRTYNSAGIEKTGTPHDNEIDHYRQTNYQVHYDQTLTPFARWTSALHYTKGKGYFEQYKADQFGPDYGGNSGGPTTDLIRRLWLDNDFYGFTSTLQIGSPAERYLVLGGGWNNYLGDHFGEVIWTKSDVGISTDRPYYFNTAVKKDWNVFGRSNLKITDHLDATVDVQARWIRYKFEGPDGSGGFSDQQVNHRFINPKLGFRYRLGDKSSLYALTGILHKEPNRDDYVNSTPASRPSPEKLWDNEFSYRLSAQKWNLEATVYLMEYKNQLVPTGRLNDVGAYNRVNVDESYRHGIEFSLAYQWTEKLKFDLNGTFSKNKIKSFDEYIDNWDSNQQEIISHKNTDIAFSPNILGSLNGEYKFISTQTHEISVLANIRYIGKQFVDNTSSDASSLDPYYITDTGLQWIWHNVWAQQFKVGFLVRNVFNHEYESNGWIYRFRSEANDPTTNDPYAGSEGAGLYHQKGYFPQAGRNMYLNLNLTF
ncbi:MAG TPA: TonB-dependent receptor [Saprospiraceae bacterium]|nr:TonB-dependent receptor [Saprospiraceae bacterium]